MKTKTQNGVIFSFISFLFFTFEVQAHPGTLWWRMGDRFYSNSYIYRHVFFRTARSDQQLSKFLLKAHKQAIYPSSIILTRQPIGSTSVNQLIQFSNTEYLDLSDTNPLLYVSHLAQLLKSGKLPKLQTIILGTTESASQFDTTHLLTFLPILSSIQDRKIDVIISGKKISHAQVPSFGTLVTDLQQTASVLLTPDSFITPEKNQNSRSNQEESDPFTNGDPGFGINEIGPDGIDDPNYRGPDVSGENEF